MHGVYIYISIHTIDFHNAYIYSSILNNTAERGAIFISRNSVELKGKTVLQSNVGPAIRVSYKNWHDCVVSMHASYSPVVVISPDIDKSHFKETYYTLLHYLLWPVTPQLSSHRS